MLAFLQQGSKEITVVREFSEEAEIAPNLQQQFCPFSLPSTATFLLQVQAFLHSFYYFEKARLHSPP